MGIKKALKARRAGSRYGNLSAWKKPLHRSLLDELESAIQSGSSERRAEMLARVTDLFIDNAPRVNDEQVGVFDDVFEYLIREIESEAMLQLSDRISAVDNAPERLIRRLAHDDAIEISGPGAGALRPARRGRAPCDRAHQEPGASRGDRRPFRARRAGHRRAGRTRRRDGRSQGRRQLRRAHLRIVAAQPGRPGERRRRSRACGGAAARAAARDVPQPARARDRRGAQAADRHRQSGDRQGDQQDHRGDFAEGRKPDRQQARLSERRSSP